MLEAETVDDAIKTLLKLQAVDLEILELEKAASQYPERLAEIDAELARHKALSDERSKELEEVERQRREIERNIAEQKEQVKKWEARLTEIKTPREYAALSREIDIAKKGMKNQEEEVLNLMEQAEALNKEIDAIERELLEKEKGYEGERKALEEKLAALDASRAELEARRQSIAEGVERQLLQRYDLIRQRRGGVALAVAEEGGTCGACRMRIQPQVYNDLLAGRPGIRMCSSCQRILYIQEESDTAEEATA
ncbi:MAG: hypothetical protein D6729_02225 [Deltaproteobacteria bacterium]|nr:MAG: hypothetical protein D6729_02225 [Deltaproteobacteria bacterium]